MTGYEAAVRYHVSVGLYRWRLTGDQDEPPVISRRIVRYAVYQQIRCATAAHISSDELDRLIVDPDVKRQADVRLKKLKEKYGQA